MSRAAALLPLLLLSTAAHAQAGPAPATTQAAPATTQAAAEFPPITIRANAIAPDEALGKIVQATGVEIVTDSQTLFAPGQGQAPGAMFIDVRRQPFWLAMDSVCRAARVGVRGVSAGDPRIVVFERNEGTPLWGDRPHVVSGPALFVPEALTRVDQRDFFRAKPAAPVVTLALDAWLDPRLQALTTAGPMRLIEAVDEAGNALPRDPADTDAAGGPNGAQWLHKLRVRLALPPDAGKRIARLRAEVTFVAISRSETWEIEKLADAKGQKRDVLGFPVEVQEVTIRPGGGAVRVGAVRGGADAATWGRFLHLFQDSLVTQMQLLDETGTPMRKPGWGSSSSAQFIHRTVDFTAEGNDQAKPTKLVWVVPTETRDVTVPIELRDLVLP
jgi:hypothetical protein